LPFRCETPIQVVAWGIW